MKSKVQVRYLVPLMSVATALLLSQAAIAADPPQGDQSGKYMESDQSSQGSSASTASQHVTGTIRSIDTSAGTVIIKGALMSKTFKADASALQGLNVGDRVDVTFSKQGDSLVASQISRSSESSGSQPSSEPSSRNPGSSSQQP